MPSMETSVALVVAQVRVVDCPFSIESGLAVSEAVGAAGGGGWWWRRRRNFLLAGAQHHDAAQCEDEHDPLQPFLLHFLLLRICAPEPLARMKPGGAGELSRFPTGSIKCNYKPGTSLLPTPIRLRIAAGKSQLLLMAPVGQHGPDLVAPGTAGLKHQVPPIRRPRREIIPSAVVAQLHPLFAGNIHQVKIFWPPGAPGPYCRIQETGQELSIRVTRPVRPHSPRR